MTPLDGLLVIAGFVLGCLPVIEWLIGRRASDFKRPPRPLVSASPWI